MVKVYGVHHLQLREGASGEDLEKFVKEEMADLHLGEGWEWHLLQCDKGDNKGEYLSLFVLESVELHDRLTTREAIEADTVFVPKWSEMRSMVAGAT